MIVCLCTAATDRHVNAVIDAGARCLCDFREHGIGTSCGSCHETLRAMMEARGVAVHELCFEEAIIARIAGRRFDETASCGERGVESPMTPRIELELAAASR